MSVQLRYATYNSSGGIDVEFLNTDTGEWYPYTVPFNENSEFSNAVQAGLADMDIAPYVPAAATAAELIAHAAQRRWEKEVGGITLSGLVIYTDDRSKIMISGARVAAEADPNFTTQWKGADGSFVTLDAAMIVAISNAVSTHVSNCFALEAQVLAQIEAGTLMTAVEIDAAFA